MNEKPPYKAGDLVTITLYQHEANLLNGGYPKVTLYREQIVDHKPEPEPHIGYLYFCDMSHCAVKIKVTWTPGTKQATAEVIES